MPYYQMHPMQQQNMQHIAKQKSNKRQRDRIRIGSGLASAAVGALQGAQHGGINGALIQGALQGAVGYGLGHVAGKTMYAEGKEMEQNPELTKEQQDLIAKQEKNLRRTQIATGVGAGLGATMGALKKGTKGQKVWNATKGAVLGGGAGYGLSKQLESANEGQDVDLFALLSENSAEVVLDALLETDEKDEKKGNWIQKIVSKHPGALHRKLGVPKDETIPPEKLEQGLEKAKKEGDTKTIKQINFAKFLSKASKK